MTKFYRIDNTGWSNGQIWFEGEERFNSYKEAEAIAIRRANVMKDSKVRIAWVSIKGDQSSKEILELYYPVNSVDLE